MTHTAPIPTKSAFRTELKFGRETIPVCLFTGAQETKKAGAEFTGVKAPAKAGDRSKNKVTGRSVPATAVYPVVEATDGTKVRFSPAERKEAQFVEGPYSVEAIVGHGSLGTVYFPTKVYQLRADVDPKLGGLANERKLALLLQVLAHPEHAGLALVQLPLAPNGSPVVALINAQGYLLVCHFSNAVREARPLPSAEFSQVEWARAHKVAAKLGGTEVPTVDRGAERIQAAVDAKAAAKQGVVQTETPVVV